MPPLPRLKTPALARLEEQIRASPRPTLLKDLARAEELAPQIEPAVTYPEDWVIFHITTSRPQLAKPDLLPGAGLQAELSTLVERLSAAARLTPAEAAPAFDVSTLCKQWGISRQTLTRLRRRGLIARRVVDDKNRAKLLFRAEVVARYQAGHESELERAAGFSRLGPKQEAAILRRAARYRRLFKWSLNQSAARIAEKLGRSHEGIRQVLRRAESRAASASTTPTFGEAPALAHKQQELLYRAARRGIDLALLARKTRRSRGAVRRAINMARARRLIELAASGSLTGPAAPSFSAKNAAETILSPAPVRTGLATAPSPDVLSFLKQAHDQGPPIGAEEKARLVAYQFLRYDCKARIEALSRLHPAAGALDRIETNLRWAARLKTELVRSQLKSMLEALHARLGKPVEELPAGVVVRLLSSALAAVGEAVDSFDPARSGRLAGAAGLAVDRCAIKWSKQLAPSGSAPKRAATMIPTGLPMPDWTREVAPWQDLIEPDRRLRAVLAGKALTTDLHEFLAQRLGYDGRPPQTLAELAKARNVNQVAVSRLETQAMREAFAMPKRQ